MSSSKLSGTDRAKETIKNLLLLWAFSYIPIMACGAFPPRWPSWFEPPWSDVSDFVVAPDGRMFVYNGFYAQMMVYDQAGDFQRSWPGPGHRPASGGHCLSIAEDGRLFVKNVDVVYALTLDGRELYWVSGDEAGPRVWRLAENGEVESVAEPPPDTRSPNRPVRNGEILFGEECSGPWPHKQYARPDGGTVRRRFGPRLEIRFPDGSSRTLMTPWYLLWAQIPYPLLAWGALAIWSKFYTPPRRWR